MRAHGPPLGCSSARRCAPRSLDRTMVMTRRQLAPLVFLALVLQLGLSLPAFAGLVLCVGSDGHVAVEGGGASGCGPVAQSPTNGCDELGYPAPCNDTPLDGSELSAASPRAGDAGTSLALAPAFVPNSARLTAANARALTAAFADPSRSQRSLTLRL